MRRVRSHPGPVAAALAAAAVAVLAAGCAGGPSAAQPATATAPAGEQAPAPPPPAPSPHAVRLTVAVSGDLLIHSPLWLRARANAGGRGYDFRPLFRAIRPYVRGADLAVCHVETPMTPRPPTGYPVFNTPPALARAIRWTGWDACDTASNHTLDAGQYGIDQTTRALARAGVRHTGAYASAAAARRTLLLRAKGAKVALLAYTQVSNGQRVPHPWSLNAASPRRILRDARRAVRRGADAVIVNVHWGDEYRHAPSPAQLALARRLARSHAVTAIVGQHAHVVQPIRRVAGKLVVFGEGNLVSNQTPSCCAAGAQDGLIALLRLRVVPGGRARVVRVDYVPVWVRHPDYVVLPVWRARVHGSAPRAELAASWSRTVTVAGRARRYGPWKRPRP